MKKERIIWLDALKGLAILSVVIGHILLGFNENNAFSSCSAQLVKMQHWIYVWHMPFFFVLSGIAFYVSYYDSEKGIKKSRVKRSCLNLFILYLIFDVGIILLKVLFANFVDNKISGGEILLNIFLPDMLMWYLWVLILYYILFLRLMVKKRMGTGSSFSFSCNCS